ncbi:MAG: ATP-binding cassette domain-containing protein [Solobacterium sp.]|nr:ATP-binding cassette domain-containing protein [Solobacterium sp.]
MLLLNKTLLRLVKGLWGWIAAIVAVRFLALIGITRFARIIAGFLGDLFSPSMNAAQAMQAVGAAFAAALLMFAAQLLQGELEYRCTAQARTSLRTKIFSQVLALDAGNIERIGPVSAVTASVDAVEKMQVYYSTYLPSLIFSLIAPFYLFFNIRRISLTAALLLLGVSVILMPLNNLFRARIEMLRGTYWRSFEDMTAYYLDSLRGLTTLKLFERDREHSQVLAVKAEKLNTDTNAFMKVNFTSFLVTEGLIYAAIIICLFMMASGLHSGTVSIADALMVLLLSYSFFSSVRTLMSATHNALTAVAAAGKVEEILAVDTSRPYDPNMPEDPEQFNGIRMDHVSFGYAGRDTALKDISIRIPKGSTCALAGLSGCGKSTAAALLMRFMDPAEGHIYFEGKDLCSMKPEELRRHIIMVPQTVSIFSGTIRDNLLLAAPEADESELMEAVRLSALKSFVDSLPDGLDTDVGDAGSRLSGGQKQKIGIARALLSKAEYIIFDEATSSVDLESEHEIWNCIHDLARTRTLIIISHRLSTIADADIIYVLNQGQTAESGSHEELMQHNGLYARLVNEQSALEGGYAA